MNPQNTFQSLRKSDSKTKLFFCMLCLQLAFILLLTSKISIPQIASNYISNLIFDDKSTTLEFENLQFSADGEILITNLRLFLLESTMVNISVAETANGELNIAIDKNGRIAIDWGVYGIPETFVVSREGIIQYRHVGPVNNKIFKKINSIIKKNDR